MIKRVSHFFHFSVRFNLNTKITNLLVSLLILWLEGIYRVVASTWHCLGHSFITHKPFLYLSQSCQGRRILSNKGSATRGVGGNSGGDCEIDREWHSRGEWDSRGHRGWDSRRDSRENSEDDSRNGEKVEGCYTAFYPKLASVHRFFLTALVNILKTPTDPIPASCRQGSLSAIFILSVTLYVTAIRFHVTNATIVTEEKTTIDPLGKKCKKMDEIFISHKLLREKMLLCSLVVWQLQKGVLIHHCNILSTEATRISTPERFIN